MSGNGVAFDSAATVKSADRLDVLADRLEADLKAARPGLFVEPAGLDEVSARAAQTFHGVATSYDRAALDGIHEMRKLAATLRAQSNRMTRVEQDNAAQFA